MAEVHVVNIRNDVRVFSTFEKALAFVSKHNNKVGRVAQFNTVDKEMFNVDDFSQMKGKLIYVLGEGEGLDFCPCGFQRLTLDWDYQTGSINRVNFIQILKQFGDKDD